MRRLARIVVVVSLCAQSLSAQIPVVQRSVEWIEAGSPGNLPERVVQPDYQKFLASASGDWNADFDPVLQTPRAIHGSGLQIFRTDATRDEVVQAVLRFLDENAALFGGEAGDFTLDGLVFNRDLWVVAAAQRHRGIPVQGSHLSLSIKNGRLILVQGVAYRVEGIDPIARLSAEDATQTAHRALGIAERRSGKQKDQDEAQAVILPLRSPGAVEYRLTWKVTTRRQGDQQALAQHVVAYVDAETGEVLAAHDGNFYEHSGTASIELEERTAGGPLISVPASFLNLTLAGAALQSDVSGSFSLNGASGPQGIVAQLRGALARVTNLQAPSASFAGTVEENVPFSLIWNESNSDPSERMTYHAIVESNRFVSPVFPSLGWLSTQVPAFVNLNDQCNAFFDGTAVNMFRGGSFCNATGRIFDVVAHEWGHGLDLNAPGGFVEGALSEFIGDLVAFVQTDDHLFAPGFFVGGGHLRDLESSFSECFDASTTNVHDAGQQLGAVVWDIHEDLEAAGMSDGDVRRLMLLPIAAAQTRSQWYLGMLAVDDDDGNLANGTPNECLIYRQFDLHSCGADRWPGIPAGGSSVTVTPAVLSPPNHRLVPVSIQVSGSDPCGSTNACRVTSVESNEPVDGEDDGSTSPDWVIDGSRVLLRAERSGSGTGRIYTLTLECSGSSGDTTTKTVEVSVPLGKQ